MEEIITRVIPLPVSVNGATVKDSNDDYNIYLNASLCFEDQVIAYNHEMKHIKLDHFFSAGTVAQKENEV